MNNDFSKTDPKDALIIATNARNGSYTEYRQFDPEVNALHRLSIAYEKVVKDRQKAVARLRALMEGVFPEYLSCIGVDTNGSLYLLERYFLPEHFQKLSVREKEKDLWRISNGNHSAPTLLKLQSLAQRSIGSHTQGEEEVLRLTLDIWIMQVQQTEKSLKILSAAMIERAKKTEHFEILISLKGISDLTASRFIAECRDLNDFDHYKQIEKYAGANVRLMDSGNYAGTRRISKIGNKRLLRLLYLMTTQTVKFIPKKQVHYQTTEEKMLPEEHHRRLSLASQADHGAD
jgi:transposase